MSVVGIANWGPLVVGTDVDDEIIATLRKWVPTYLAQLRIERNLSFNLARIRTYANTFEGQEFLDHQLPAIVATTANLTAAQGGPNTPHQGTWQSLVACVVRGRSPAATRYLCALYGGTVARVLTQQSGSVQQGVRYPSMRYEPVVDGTGNSRWLLAAVNEFDVYSDEILQPWGGPDKPDADVYVDEATVVDVEITVNGELIAIPAGGP
jgi:hypothetical protein